MVKNPKINSSVKIRIPTIGAMVFELHVWTGLIQNFKTDPGMNENNVESLKNNHNQGYAASE